MSYKCAVIGLGRIGCGFDDNPNAVTVSTHAGAYYHNRKTKLIALCDIDEKKLLKYGPKYNVKRLYTDYSEMLRKEKLDCISICTHADSHYQIVKEASRYGVKGIFLEKPISNSLNDAKKIIYLCKKKKIKLQVNHQRRFDPFYHNLKKLISSKKFGSIQNFSVYYGGGVANTGSHIFDLIRLLVSDVRWVKASTNSDISQNTVDPNIDGVIACKNGIKCSLKSFDYNKFGILEFDIIGTKGRVKLNLTSGDIEYYESSSPKVGLFYNELIQKQVKQPPKTSAISNGLNNLLFAIEKKKELLCRGEDGYASLEIIISLIDSANRNGKKMFLPLKNNNRVINAK